MLDQRNFDKPPLHRVRPYKVSDRKKTVNMTWSTEKNEHLRQQRRGTTNIIPNSEGPRGAAKGVKDIPDAFHLYFTAEMVDTVVTNTNKAIDVVLEKHKELVDNDSRYSYYRNVDAVEIEAFFGLL